MIINDDAIMHFPSLLTPLAKQRLDELTELQPLSMAQWQHSAQDKLLHAVGLSDFIYESVKQQPSLLTWLCQHQAASTRLTQYRSDLAALLGQADSENSFLSLLRQFRRQEMVWLAWQDFNQQLPLAASLQHLSALAEAIIIESYHWLYNQCCIEWGTPCNAEGVAQPMLILGMGKLGGNELNFSSDIDLIFTYPENGETTGTRRALANVQFFTRLGQRLIRALDQKTVNGFCYRVDMRLRPFGDSGPLVMSFAALEEYYQEQGREWERYAMVKARLLGHEQTECYQQLQRMLKPFVFRRYIDFSAVESLRRMKTSIQAEVRRRALTDNIKLGAGGIREIEFIAQSFQLIRGGREPSLQSCSLFTTLSSIQSLGLLAANEVEALTAAYCYLRRVENALQAIDDKQTQSLPQEPLNQARLAYALQQPDWPALKAAIDAHMLSVHQIFRGLIGTEDDKEPIDTKYQLLWDEPSSLAEQYPAGVTILSDFKQEVARRTIGPRGREVLAVLMPKLLKEVMECQDNDQLLPAILKLLGQIVTRTAYLELLNENPSAIAHLTRLCAASPMIAQQISTFPMLLDELIDPKLLYHPLAFSEYHSVLFEYLARIPRDDIEQQMEQIRQFKQTQLLRIAAADIAKVLPIMQVSDHLTYLAEAIVDAVIHQAWEQVTQKYGVPSHLHQDEQQGYGFAVIAYGKLGGLELSYGSDLDLVFVHDSPANSSTDGIHSIDSGQFYLRLAQRIIHLFSTRTNSGVLYEIDMRLRPSGSSGMLVTNLHAFEQYQHNQAWVWEHQALVRARAIYGNERLKTAFAEIRAGVLMQQRNNNQLKHEVATMREKMRVHLAPNNHNQEFHLKQDRGGIVDIEFITQYLMLAHAHDKPSLCSWSDNMRILDQMLEADILPKQQIEALQQAYTKFRYELHRLTLLNGSSTAQASLFAKERHDVEQIWQQLLVE